MMHYSLIPKNMTNDESKMIADIVVSFRDFNIAQAKLIASKNRWVRYHSASIV